MSNRIKWTEKEDSILKQLIKSGKHPNDISGELLNRTINSIYSRMTILKLNSPNSYKTHWNSEEIIKLVELEKENKSTKEIASILKRPIKSVESKLSRILTERTPYWSSEQDRILKEEIEKGTPIEEISDILKTKNKRAIYHRAKILGIVLSRTIETRRTKIFKKKYPNYELINKLNSRYYAIKNRCKENGDELKITRDDLVEQFHKQNGLCFYTGIKMELSSNNIHYVLSVDRMDSLKTYTKDNIVLCCWIINTMKSNLEINEFYKLCQKIIDYKNSI